LARVTVNTTVQLKNITFPTDAKLLHAAITGRGAISPRRSVSRLPTSSVPSPRPNARASYASVFASYAGPARGARARLLATSWSHRSARSAAAPRCRHPDRRIEPPPASTCRSHAGARPLQGHHRSANPGTATAPARSSTQKRSS
jgi:IS5 family transposase